MVPKSIWQAYGVVGKLPGSTVEHEMAPSAFRQGCESVATNVTLEHGRYTRNEKSQVSPKSPRSVEAAQSTALAQYAVS